MVGEVIVNELGTESFTSDESMKDEDEDEEN
jgi:hypothetical protein